MQVKLSIIIPTKNRYNYLKAVIQILIKIERQDVEFVITDNSTDDVAFEDFIKSLNDSRIRYFFIKHNISQTENSDYALSNAIGKYVCFIGDDDIILDNIFLMIDEMEKKNIDCLIQSPVDYYWSDVKFKYSLGSQRPSSFLFDDNYRCEFVNIDIEKELSEILQSGATKIGQLPKIYHGLVKMELLEKVKLRCGSYFPGPSPDMASSVALALFNPVTMFSKMPFTVAGKSGKSASGMGLTHTHIGGLANKDFLPKDIIETWDIKIPQFWSCATIWAQSALSSLRASNSKLDINYSKLYVNLLVFEPHFNKEIQLKVDEYCTVKDKLAIKFGRALLFVSRVKSFIQRKYFSYNGMTTYHDIVTIDECYVKVNDMIKKNMSNDFPR